MTAILEPLPSLWTMTTRAEGEQHITEEDRIEHAPLALLRGVLIRIFYQTHYASHQQILSSLCFGYVDMVLRTQHTFRSP